MGWSISPNLLWDIFWTLTESITWICQCSWERCSHKSYLKKCIKIMIFLFQRIPNSLHDNWYNMLLTKKKKHIIPACNTHKRKSPTFMTCKTFTVKPATAYSLKQMSYHSDNTDTRNGLHLQPMPAVTLAYLVTTSTCKMLLNQPDNAL